MSSIPPQASVTTSQNAATTSRFTKGEVLGHLFVTLVLIALVLYTRGKIARDDSTRNALRVVAGQTATPSETNQSGAIRIRNMHITQKWSVLDASPKNDTFDFLLGTEKRVYWVSWGKPEQRASLQHRINLPYDRWQNLKEGDTLEIITFGDDTTPLLRDDISLSAGNRKFDVILLWVWQIGATLTLLALPFSIYAYFHPEKM